MALRDFVPTMQNLEYMSKQTLLVSSVPQMIGRANKLWVFEQLKAAAKTATRTPYPIIMDILDPLNPQLEVKSRDCLVLKRTFSESTEDVDKTDIKALEAERLKYYDHPQVKQYGVRPRWFCISYVPEMMEKGEICVFFIGGKPTYMLRTRLESDGFLDIEEAILVTPLRRLV